MWFIDKIKGVFETRSKPVDQPQTNTLPIVMGKSADTSRTNSSIIFGALNLISNAVARAPIRHLIGYEKIENDDLSFLLNVRPNDYITAMRFWQKIVYDLIWHGNGYA
ncbi:phage portal protein, partial [Paenibacillus larvae]